MSKEAKKPKTTFKKKAINMKKLQSFNTKEEAIEWMIKEVDDPYLDNVRFAIKELDFEMQDYSNRQYEGCCGSFDQDVVVNNELCIVGCNYGH